MFGGTLFVAVHPIVKKIYRNVLPQVPLAGRLKYFQENWKILTNDFKMEGLHLIKDLLREGDYMVKLDLKDAYFSLKNESKK